MMHTKNKKGGGIRDVLYLLICMLVLDKNFSKGQLAFRRKDTNGPSHRNLDGNKQLEIFNISERK